MSEEKKSNTMQWTLVLPAGALTLLGALMLTVSNEAHVGLKLAEQHGESILLLREEVRLLRQEVRVEMRDRYTSNDAKRDLQYIQRDIAELKETIKELHSGPSK